MSKLLRSRPSSHARQPTPDRSGPTAERPARSPGHRVVKPGTVASVHALKDRLSGITHKVGERGLRVRVDLRGGRQGEGVSWPVHPAALLLGVALGWQWAGTRTLLAAHVEPYGATTMTGAIALLAAALAPLFPERILLGAARFLRRRVREREPYDIEADHGNAMWMLHAVRERDPSLTWLALALAACVAGVASVLTLGLIGLWERVYAHLLAGFFWTDLTLTGVEWVGTAIVIGFAWLIHGVAFMTLVPVTGRRREAHRSGRGVLASVLLGFGMALLVQEVWLDAGWSARQIYLAGLMAMFVLAGVAALVSQRADRRRLRRDAETDSFAPELTSGAEGLIWLSLVVWGIAAVLAGAGWVACRDDQTAGPLNPGRIVSWFALLTGAGMVIASIPMRPGHRSASGCGMATWAAGVLAGVAATLLAFEGTRHLTTLPLLLIAMPLGYALHYAERAWLARIGSGTLGFAQMASAVLAGLGLGLILVRWWSLPKLGSLGTLTAGALLMLAVGGLIQIYEEHRPRRIQHLRLALVFASLAAAIVLFPGNARRWNRVVKSVPAPPPSPIDLRWVSSEPLPSARALGLIGVDAAEAAGWPGRGHARLDIMPFLDRPDRNPLISRDGRVRAFSTNALRMLRLEKPRYDLLYQEGAHPHPLPRHACYTLEWFEQLRQHVIPGGSLVVDVPLGGMTRQAVCIVVATFREATDSPVQWRLIGGSEESVLRMAAFPIRSARYRPTDRAGWTPSEVLLQREGPVPIHLIRRDTMTRALRPTRDRPSIDPADWLDALERPM